MPFKHYIRSIEGKTETIKEFHEKPTWFYKTHVEKILGGLSCFSWFPWSSTPQGSKYWEQYCNLTYDTLPPESKEIIDSWIAQVKEEAPHVSPAW